MGSASSTLPSGFSPPKSAAPSAARFSSSAASASTLGGKSSGISWFSLVRRSCTIASSSSPSDTRAVPRQRPSSTFSSGVTSSSSPIFGAAFNAETSTSSRKSSRGSAGRHRTPRGVWFRVAWTASSFWRRSSTRMIRPSGFRILPPRCCGDGCRATSTRSPCHASPKKPGWIKISGCSRDSTRSRLPPSTGFGASSADSCTASGVTNPAPERWMDSTPVTIRACDASTHLPPRSRMTRPSACRASSRLSSGFLSRRDKSRKRIRSSRRTGWRILPISPSTSSTSNPPGTLTNACSTSVRRAFFLPGRAGLEVPFRTVSAKYPRWRGCFFIGKPFWMWEGRGRGIGGAEGKPIQKKGFFPLPELHAPPPRTFIQAGVRPGHDAEPGRPEGPLQGGGIGTEKRHG